MFANLRGKLIARNIKGRNHYSPFFQASLTILRKYNIVYVENSKVGCTKIKKNLLEIDNYPRKWGDIISKEVHIHNKELTGMIGAADLSNSGLYNILTSREYFRFGFVRNPYGRLLSAYKDKIFAPQKSSDKKAYVRVAREIKSAISGKRLESVNLDETPVSFEEFVTFIVNQRPYDMDRHWFHQHFTMWHPYCKLDFVGYFENFANDLHELFSIIGAPDSMISAVNMRDNASHGSKKLYYNRHLGEAVYKKYRKDFELYGYKKCSWSEY